MSDSARYNAELAMKSMSTADLLSAVREIDESKPSTHARSRHKARTRRDVYQAELTRRPACVFLTADQVADAIIDRIVAE